MPDLQDSVLISLRRIMRATSLHSRHLEKQSGLTTPQLVVLRSIGERDAITASEIARAVSLSQATVTIILGRLEERGLIERHRNTQDRRRVDINLSESGRAALATAPMPLQDQFTARFQALPAWEQHQMVSALERIASMMDADQIDAAPFLEGGEKVR